MDFIESNRSSCSLTVCSVISRLSIVSEAILHFTFSAIFHSPGGSCVKIDEKRFDRVSAFSSSFVVHEPSSVIRAGITFFSTVFCRT